MLKRLLPAIKVHSWGGFGSQLFALLQYRNLDALYPGRRIVLVFHSSGVTRRGVEIQLFLSSISWCFVDDFQEKEPDDSEKDYSNKVKKVKSAMFGAVKQFLLFIGVLIELESRQEIRRAKPWLLSVRGHYSYFKYDESLFLKLLNDFEDKIEFYYVQDCANDALVIQYRLGDLTTLESKTFIDPKLIRQVIEKVVAKETSQPQIHILTDSLDYLSKLNFGKSINFTSSCLDPIETVIVGVRAKYFIGTASKLSLWIGIFRALAGKETYLPHAFQTQINLFAANPTSVYFYCPKKTLINSLN